MLTGRSFDSDGTVQWALNHGWEGINVADSKRTNRLLGQFCSGAGKGFVRQWLDRYGLDMLVKLLEAREWRLALREWGKARLSDLEGSTIESFFYWRDVLEHCILFRQLVITWMET